uniref:Uncharacterized protein n=1 Tax=Magallana gigas TaxID=29159 RepID=A0A8W8NFD3_MAGGI
MNKAVILLGTSCLLAIAIMQVSAFYGSSMMYGGGMGYAPSTIGGGAASRGYYDNYYQRYDQYNRAQSARTIARTVNGLQTSSLLSLISLFARTSAWSPTDRGMSTRPGTAP